MDKIYSVSWGYSMTLNSFFKVIKETPKGAIVREISSTKLEDAGYMCGYETPDPNAERTETDWNKEPKILLVNGIEQSLRPIKYKDFRVIKTENGYKGTVGLSRTHYLTETKVGDKHYYNNCD